MNQEEQTYTFNLDPALFKEQRSTLLEIISEELQNPRTLLNPNRLNSLEGLCNLLDCISDQAADNYGLDVLLTEQC